MKKVRMKNKQGEVLIKEVGDKTAMHLVNCGVAEYVKEKKKGSKKIDKAETATGKRGEVRNDSS